MFSVVCSTGNGSFYSYCEAERFGLQCLNSSHHWPGQRNQWLKDKTFLEDFRGKGQCDRYKVIHLSCALITIAIVIMILLLSLSLSLSSLLSFLWHAFWDTSKFHLHMLLTWQEFTLLLEQWRASERPVLPRIAPLFWPSTSPIKGWDFPNIPIFRFYFPLSTYVATFELRPSVDVFMWLSMFITDASDFPSDEEHETGVIKTNLIYRVDCTSDPPSLKLRDDLSGRVLSENFMDNSQVRKWLFYSHCVALEGFRLENWVAFNDRPTAQSVGQAIWWDFCWAPLLPRSSQLSVKQSHHCIYPAQIQLTIVSWLRWVELLMHLGSF